MAGINPKTDFRVGVPRKCKADVLYSARALNTSPSALKDLKIYTKIPNSESSATRKSSRGITMMPLREALIVRQRRTTVAH